MPRVESPRNGRSRRHASRGRPPQRWRCWFGKGSCGHVGGRGHLGRPPTPAAVHPRPGQLAIRRSGEGPPVERHHGVGHRVEREALLELRAMATRARRARSAVGLAQRRPATPSASAAGSSGGTSRAHEPARSGIGPTALATTGAPSAMASTRMLPRPSHRDGTTNASAAHSRSGTSSRGPISSIPGVGPLLVDQLARAARSGCPDRPPIAGRRLGLGRPDRRPGPHQHVEALLVLVAGRGHDQRRVVVDAQRSTHRGSTLGTGPAQPGRGHGRGVPRRCDRTDAQARAHHRGHVGRQRVEPTSQPSGAAVGRRGPPRASTASARGWLAARARRPR